MDGIVFGMDRPDIRIDAFYAAVTRRITSKEALFDELYNLLHFPGYFGFNWDALSDCLGDFDWIDACNIVIAHEILPELPEDDFKIYLRILLDAIDLWNKNKEHLLEVRFRQADEAGVRLLLSQL